jgi:hypothetical protein
MTRLTHLLSTLTIAALCAGGAIAACGSRAPAPGEMPRLAPQPDTVRPNAMPMNGAVSTREAVRQPSPVYQAASEAQPLSDQPTGATLDAGTSDGGGAPLPPLRDGSVPADSRMEPILQRDGGK